LTHSPYQRAETEDSLKHFPFWVTWQLSPDSDPDEGYILVDANTDCNEEHPLNVIFGEHETAAKAADVANAKMLGTMAEDEAIQVKSNRKILDRFYDVVQRYTERHPVAFQVTRASTGEMIVRRIA
jgi:hypothetical protein